LKAGAMPIQMEAATSPFPFRKPFKNSNFKKKEINPKWLKYANSNKKRPGGIGISDGGFWIAEFRKCGFGQEVETRPRLGIGLSGRKTALFFRPSQFTLYERHVSEWQMLRYLDKAEKKRYV
jgi:hypothetical protein